MTLGEHLTETDENDGGGDEEEEEEEEEEVPDNLTFGEKTLGLLVEGINKFQNNLLEFCSFSSKQSSETNLLLSNLSKKLDKSSQLVGSASSASSSSTSIPSSSSSRHSSLDKSSQLVGSASTASSSSTSIPSSSSSRHSSFEAESSLFERSLANALKGSMPGIRQVLTRQSVVAPDKIL